MRAIREAARYSLAFSTAAPARSPKSSATSTSWLSNTRPSTSSATSRSRARRSSARSSARARATRRPCYDLERLRPQLLLHQLDLAAIGERGDGELGDRRERELVVERGAPEPPASLGQEPLQLLGALSSVMSSMTLIASRTPPSGSWTAVAFIRAQRRSRWPTRGTAPRRVRDEPRQRQPAGQPCEVSGRRGRRWPRRSEVGRGVEVLQRLAVRDAVVARGRLVGVDQPCGRATGR